MPVTEARRKWEAQNTVFFGVKLQRSTDGDIIAVLEPAGNKQAEIKRLLRLAIALEKGEVRNVSE